MINLNEDDGKRQPLFEIMIIIIIYMCFFNPVKIVGNTNVIILAKAWFRKHHIFVIFAF